MPTIQQLVRKSRKRYTKKPKAPALRYGFNLKKNRPVQYSSPFKRGVCIQVKTMTPKKPNSALRKVARGPLAECGRNSGIFPGCGPPFQEPSLGVGRGGRVKDLPGVR